MAKLTKNLKGALGARTKVQAALRHVGSGPRPFDPRRAAPVDAGAMNDFDHANLVGTIGRLYTARGLSPPSQLYAAARHWLGVDHSEIIAAIEGWLYDNRQRFVSGSGDAHFAEVEGVVRRLWEQKHGVMAGGAIDPALSAPRPRGQKHLYGKGGFTDVIDFDGVSEDITRPGSPQPVIDQRRDYVTTDSIGEDVEDDA